MELKLLISALVMILYVLLGGKTPSKPSDVIIEPDQSRQESAGSPVNSGESVDLSAPSG